MTTQSFKLDCTSPLIDYQPPSSWQRGEDADTSSYDNKTFMFAFQPGATMSFNWTGTSITLVGAYRTNHGPFSVQIDDQPHQTIYPPGGDHFQENLFSKDGLDMGIHTVFVTNVGAGNTNDFDIDYLEFNTDYNSSSDMHVQSNAFKFDPPNAWNQIDTTVFPGFDNNDGNVTLQANASATINFSGDRITLYGAVGDSGSPYTVQLDDGDVVSFNASRPGYGYIPQQILYHVDNLPIVERGSKNSGGKHKLIVTSTPSEAGQLFSLDYVVVDGSVNADLMQASNTSISTSKSIPAGILAAIAAGTIAFFLLLFIALFFFYRRRLRRRRGEHAAKLKNYFMNRASGSSSTELSVNEMAAPFQSAAFNMPQPISSYGQRRTELDLEGASHQFTESGPGRRGQRDMNRLTAVTMYTAVGDDSFSVSTTEKSISGAGSDALFSSQYGYGYGNSKFSGPGVNRIREEGAPPEYSR